MFVKILEDVMLPFSSWEMPIKKTFEQNNGPKHANKLAKKRFA